MLPRTSVLDNRISDSYALGQLHELGTHMPQFDYIANGVGNGTTALASISGPRLALDRSGVYGSLYTFQFGAHPQRTSRIQSGFQIIASVTCSDQSLLLVTPNPRSSDSIANMARLLVFFYLGLFTEDIYAPKWAPY